MITICFTYFKSLTLAHLRAALYSVRQQKFARVTEVVIVDNDTLDAVEDIQVVIDELAFPVPVRLRSLKHGDPTKTHAWSSNTAVEQVRTPWVSFSRADYILDFTVLERFEAVARRRESDWNGFVTGNGYHLSVDIACCEQVAWREHGTRLLRKLPGTEFDYTCVDTGVWMARREAFEAVGGLDESLSAWGHAQTHFQHKLHVAGVEFIRVPEVLFYHPMHSASRDLDLAHRQLQDIGVDLREMWSRYHGARVY